MSAPVASISSFDQPRIPTIACRLKASTGTQPPCQHDRVVIRNIQPAFPSLIFFGHLGHERKRPQRIQHVFINLRQRTIRSARIRPLRLHWIEHALDRPQVLVSQRLGALAFVTASAVPIGPMLGREKPIFIEASANTTGQHFSHTASQSQAA